MLMVSVPPAFFSMPRFSVSLEALAAEEADFSRLLAAVERIRSASEAELHELEWLHEMVCSVGVAMLEPVDETYQDMAHLVCGSHQGISQYPREFARWLHLLGEVRPATYLEIGTFNGNTASLAAAYLQRIEPAARVVTIDLFPSFLFYDRVRERLPLEYRVGVNSFALREEKFDAVFIDGDHSFDWAWADYVNVGRAARLCGMHDVCSEFYHDSEAYGGVTAAWEFIRHREGGAGIEFREVSDHPAGDRFGIGVRLRA
jgi:SAM-dependent methyltransferase